MPARRLNRLDPSYEPLRNLSLELVAADLKYIGGCIVYNKNPKQWAFFQHAATIGYEVSLFYPTIQIESPELEWNRTFVKAMRHSGKLLENTGKNIVTIQAEFQQIITAQSMQDVAIQIARQKPITNTVSDLFTLNMLEKPDHALIQHSLKKMSEGVGQMAATTGLTERELKGHGARVPRVTLLNQNTFLYFGKRSSEAALAAWLRDVVQVADRLARPRCCEACKFAALKQRLMITYNTIGSLQALNFSHLSGSVAGVGNSVMQSTILQRVRGLHALRDALVHYGMWDLPVGPSRLTREDICLHYGSISMDELSDLIDNALIELHPIMDALFEALRVYV